MLVKNIFLIFICVPLLVMLGCKKVAPNISGTVSGIVRDTINSTPVANAKIFVLEMKQGLYGPEPIGTVGSTVSGIDGKYTVQFTTTGKGIQYQVQCQTDSTYDNWTLPIKVIAGKNNTANFSVLKLLPVNARIIVKNNPYPPLTILLGESSFKINGTNNDTTGVVWIPPWNDQDIQFSIQVPGEAKQRYLDQPIVLTGSSPYSQTFTVDPSTFPKSN